MQESANAEPGIARPRGASAAYGAVIRRTESSRDIEYRVFAEVTADLQDAARPEATPVRRITAIERNRQFWVALACDVAGENNRLSEALRANIISLAIWVNGESARLLRENGPLVDLIETNKIVMAGLAPPAPAESDKCPSS